MTHHNIITQLPRTIPIILSIPSRIAAQQHILNHTPITIYHIIMAMGRVASIRGVGVGGGNLGGMAMVIGRVLVTMDMLIVIEIEIGIEIGRGVVEESKDIQNIIIQST